MCAKTQRDASHGMSAYLKIGGKSPLGKVSYPKKAWVQMAAAEWQSPYCAVATAVFPHTSSLQAPWQYGTALWRWAHEDAQLISGQVFHLRRLLCEFTIPRVSYWWETGRTQHFQQIISIRANLLIPHVYQRALQIFRIWAESPWKTSLGHELPRSKLEMTLQNSHP